jgi:citrate synthase
MASRRAVPPNVDLYAAPLYHAIGIPVDLFAVTFALGRVVGWTAHIMEQRADNRLIRPLADYQGPAPRAFVPLDARRS